MKVIVHHRSGNTLLLTLVITGIIGFTLASYLTLASSQNAAIVRSATWNGAMPIAESGVEEALDHLTRNTNSLAVDGWTANSGTYSKLRTMAGGYYTVDISGGPRYTITSTGYAQQTDRPGFLSRKVQVDAQKRPRFIGMVAKQRIQLGGSIDCDSYDSSDPLYSTGGAYDAAKRRDHSFVGTNSRTNNSLILGNTNVKGRVATGPGGSIGTSGSTSVGDMSWNSKGIQPGHSSDDMNISVPDVSVPFTVGYPAASGTVNGTNYNHVLGGGNFLATSLSGSIIVTAPSVLYVTGNANLSQIIIKSGGRLDLYVGGANCSVTSGLVNEGGIPANFNYYGLPGNTSVTIGGNAQFVGTIYAPGAAFNASGTSDVYGGIIVNEVNSSGSFGFHFDESLLSAGQQNGMTISGWREL